MRSHFKKHSSLKQVVRVSLFIIIFMMVLSPIVRGAQDMYYQYAPIGWFYQQNWMFPADVCVGETKQLIISSRYVKQTHIGYDAQVNKELFLLSNKNRVKVYEESSTPFIEKTENGIVARLQTLPSDLEPGVYQWALKVNIVLGNITRTDVTVFISNEFEVNDCDI